MRNLLSIAMLMFASLFISPAFAEFDEGIEYVEISPQAPMDKNAPVEVVEFFWYGCPHCFQFEPHLERWKQKKPENVQFLRMPATFNPLAKYHAQVFFALDLMGEADRLLVPMFEEIHQKRNRLADDAAILEFLKTQGFDQQKLDGFGKVMKSFAVQTKVRQAESLFRKYGLSGVPSVVVSGRYRSGEVKSYAQLIDVTDHMVKLATAEQKTSE